VYFAGTHSTQWRRCALAGNSCWRPSIAISMRWRIRYLQGTQRASLR